MPTAGTGRVRRVTRAEGQETRSERRGTGDERRDERRGRHGPVAGVGRTHGDRQYVRARGKEGCVLSTGYVRMYVCMSKLGCSLPTMAQPHRWKRANSAKVVKVSRSSFKS